MMETDKLEDPFWTIHDFWRKKWEWYSVSIIIKDQTLTSDKATSLKDAYIVNLNINILIASLSWTGKIILYVYTKIVLQNETITCTTKGQSSINTMIRNQIHRWSISFNSLTSFFLQE